PVPRRRDVDKIEGVALAEIFKIMIAVRITGGRLLAGLFDDALGGGDLVFNDVAQGGDLDAVNAQELIEHAGAARADADDSKTNPVARLELHVHHVFIRSLRPGEPFAYRFVGFITKRPS